MMFIAIYFYNIKFIVNSIYYGVKLDNYHCWLEQESSFTC